MLRSPVDFFAIWVYMAGIITTLLLSMQCLKKKRNYPFIYFLAGYTVINFLYALYYDGWYVKYPELAMILILMGTIIGPITLHLTEYMTKQPPSRSIRLNYHLTPFYGFTFAMLGGYLIFPEILIRWAEEVIFFERFNFLHVIAIVSFSWFAFYGGLVTRLILIERSAQNLSNMNAYIYFLMFGWVSATIVVSGLLSRNNHVSEVGFTLHTLKFIGILFYSSRYPAFFHNMIGELNEDKHSSVSLLQIDIAKLQSRLDNLMSEEKLYLDAEIKAADIATRLGITSQQLTKILFVHYKQNFKDFINSFRIQDAKKMLTSDDEISILRIAFDSGFNSKSTFNEVFKKKVGMTPTEFRDLPKSQEIQ